MVLVLENNGNLLYLFSSVLEAESRLEAIDVENQEYEFCDDVGQRFVGEITAPVTMLRSGSFRLHPEGLPDRTIIESFLNRARSLDRVCNGIKSLDDLRKHLNA